MQRTRIGGLNVRGTQQSFKLLLFYYANTLQIIAKSQGTSNGVEKIIIFEIYHCQFAYTYLKKMI